jgi:diguanylate cyclase (GGDEF)-like protein
MMQPHRERAKILLVDDSPTNLQLLGGILSPHYDILVAASGKIALEIVRDLELPDLILLDVKMPDMDGYATCQILKENNATRNIPIIFVTAVEGSQAETKGFELGAVDYITKPYSAPVVLARVRTHIALKKHAELLENLAFLDGLTSIANRRQFDQQLEKEWRRMMRQGEHLALLMIDIDNFKRFNDHYGHGAGDECLRLVAYTITGIIKRPGDLAARYGGEEFAVILPDTDASGALSVAEIMRFAVDKLAHPHAASAVADHVTISIGIASQVPQRQGNLQDLINLADQALYRAKAMGRNQVCA